MKHEALPEGATVVRWQLEPDLWKGTTRQGRESWGPGEWENEPDRVEWRKPGSLLPRMIVRNRVGGLCGYVGVAQGHRCYGKGWDHSGDQAPGLQMGKVFEWESYKDLGYVIRQVEGLAAQLEEAGAGGQ
jgi:hypothetical protein